MKNLRHRLAVFMKNKRGTKPLREFAIRYSISKDTISRIEKEEQNVTIDTLEHLCQVFNCDIEEMFEKEDKS